MSLKKRQELSATWFYFKALSLGLTEQDFWKSTPRIIMTLLMHFLIENGAIKTKAQVEAEQAKSIEKALNLFGAIDNRKSKK